MPFVLDTIGVIRKGRENGSLVRVTCPDADYRGGSCNYNPGEGSPHRSSDICLYCTGYFNATVTRG
jgi:hypothetical protein